MAILHLRDARILLDGFDLSGNFTDLNVEHSAEMLDRTTMGASTRIRRGGLLVSDVSGSGYYEDDLNGAADAIFNLNGTSDTLVTVFANGINEGTSTDMGFAMKGVVERLDFSESAGGLLGFEFAILGRGIG